MNLERIIYHEKDEKSKKALGNGLAPNRIFNAILHSLRQEKGTVPF
jgi:hypothetical protein